MKGKHGVGVVVKIDDDAPVSDTESVQADKSAGEGFAHCLGGIGVRQVAQFVHYALRGGFVLLSELGELFFRGVVELNGPGQVRRSPPQGGRSQRRLCVQPARVLVGRIQR